MTSEVNDEEFQTLADSMDMDTLRGDYFEGGVFLLLDRTYTIDTDGNGKYRVYETAAIKWMDTHAAIHDGPDYVLTE